MPRRGSPPRRPRAQRVSRQRRHSTRSPSPPPTGPRPISRTSPPMCSPGDAAMNGNDNPVLFLFVFVVFGFWLIRVNMAAIDRRARSMESYARSRGLAFSSADPFELASLPFEIIGVRGGVAVTNVAYGVREDLPVIVFDLRHQVSVGQSSTMQFSCAVTTMTFSAPAMVIARRVVGEHQLGAVVGGGTGVVTESVEFDREFVVRCDDRRFA